MKKLFIVLSLVFAVLISNAQMATVYVPVNQTYVAAPTTYVLTDAVTQYLLIKAPQHNVATQDLLVKLDSLTGNHTYIAVGLYGRKFDTSAWVQIGSTVTWKGTTSSHDTTLVISNTTGNRYRDYKVSYTGTGTGTSRITLQQFKLYFEN